MIRLGVFFFLVSLPYAAFAHWKAAGSGNLVELYTSEGCSSCPSADRWLSSLKDDGNLWKSIVPLAFHVNYWDRLGWPDRFAKAEFTQRQRAHAKRWGTATIYTPEIVIQGVEAHATNSFNTVKGFMKAEWDGKNLKIEAAGFEGDTVFVAWLGMGQVSEVKRGKNSGKKLTHDFVVLGMSEVGEYRQDKNFLLPKPEEAKASEALAVWIERKGVPVLAVGGRLP